MTSIHVNPPGAAHCKLSPVRTYSHAILTYAAMRLAKQGSSKKTALAAGIGATLPDIPMALGASWLWTKRWGFSRSEFDDEVCGRSLFRGPDAALHSALAAASAMFAERALRGKNSSFLIGWAGHILADFLTHGNDARPIFWPLSKWKFESPVSYRDEERFGTMSTIVEHAAVLAILILAAAERNL